MSEEQIERLKTMAVADHRSMADLIRQAVDNFFASRAGINVKERRSRVLSVTGRFHSGTGDFYEAHDKYLAEA